MILVLFVVSLSVEWSEVRSILVEIDDTTVATDANMHLIKNITEELMI